MPNWCQCNLMVRGEEEDLKKFKEKANGKNTVLSLAKLAPIPIGMRFSDPIKQAKEEKEILKKKFGTDSLNDWCITNWGTKWETDEANIDNEDEYFISYSFMTAWSPPLEGLRKASEDFPALTLMIDYDEPGGGYKGIAKIVNGKLDDHTIEY